MDLGFLDFSTAERRRRFAERELALNAPAAPGLYRGVHGIAGDRLVAADDPAAGEWALEMAPVAPGDFLDAVAARGGVDDAMLDGMADAVARLHAAGPPVRAAGSDAPVSDVPVSDVPVSDVPVSDVPVFDAPGRFRAVLRGNARAAVSAGLPRGRVIAWRRGAERWLRRLAPVLAARAAAGRVVRGHGDLHLGNMVLWEGAPTPFDALEFDEDLATVDVGYDLAFLLADLLRRCGRAAATRVLARSVARTGDAGLVAALPLWLSTRAMIRAHCLARVPDGGPMAQAFLDDAEARLRPAAPMLVAVGGLRGTGKTWLARRLAPLIGAAPGALHLRTDEVRKRLAGVAPEERLPPEFYAPGWSARVHAELLAMAEAALRGGHAVVTDAVFLDPGVRAAVEAVAARASAPFHGFWLEAEAAVLESRIGGRRGDASDATVEIMRRAALADPGAMTWGRLDASHDALPAALDALGLKPGAAVPESC